ncbi:hypothetical protein FQZ97_996590 [compost metagenome]
MARAAKISRVSSSGIRAQPNTFCQPNKAARPGANSAASTVPELPAPAMPMALPWCSGGYHCEASGRETAKAAPAKPRNRPSNKVCS